mgnify:CR=1 FL=1
MAFDQCAKLAASAVTKVVYDDDSLKAVVDEFVADYKDFTGIKLTAKEGAPPKPVRSTSSRPTPRPRSRSSATKATRWTSRPTAWSPSHPA